ncbi:phosphoprotein [Sunguru virus]|uniref:Phosphoprotein n=1 Tax=Sunguru virus TaxID=1491491 RepID=A0A023T1I9_9RHAB|nr:phosphoprotein [Sunguru virus]AHX81839.1 phosphoprotein [Sunguru virus]
MIDESTTDRVCGIQKAIAGEQCHDGSDHILVGPNPEDIGVVGGSINQSPNMDPLATSQAGFSRNWIKSSMFLPWDSDTTARNDFVDPRGEVSSDRSREENSKSTPRAVQSDRNSPSGERDGNNIQFKRGWDAAMTAMEAEFKRLRLNLSIISSLNKLTLVPIPELTKRDQADQESEKEDDSEEEEEEQFSKSKFVKLVNRGCLKYKGRKVTSDRVDPTVLQQLKGPMSLKDWLKNVLV